MTFSFVRPGTKTLLYLSVLLALSEHFNLDVDKKICSPIPFNPAPKLSMFKLMVWLTCYPPASKASRGAY